MANALMVAAASEAEKNPSSAAGLVNRQSPADPITWVRPKSPPEAATRSPARPHTAPTSAEHRRGMKSPGGATGEIRVQQHQRDVPISSINQSQWGERETVCGLMSMDDWLHMRKRSDTTSVHSFPSPSLFARCKSMGDRNSPRSGVPAFSDARSFARVHTPWHEDRSGARVDPINWRESSVSAALAGEARSLVPRAKDTIETGLPRRRLLPASRSHRETVLGFLSQE